jgi:hypothetical protein
MPHPNTTPKNRALCCQRGNLRTVAARYRPWPDINRSMDGNEHPDGWRCTLTLKCAVCNEAHLPRISARLAVRPPPGLRALRHCRDAPASAAGSGLPRR